MSATEELRRLLDERGVKWGARDTHRLLVTSCHDASGHSWAFMEYRDGSSSKLTAYRLTPEQAVAATLGNEGSYTRDDVESAFVSGYSLGCLPVGSDPQWDQNEQTVDEHMAELGWVRAELLPDMRARVVE